VNGRNYRVKLLTGLAAVGLAMTGVAPSFAQPAPGLGSWPAGPDGQGASTIIGRIEAPRARQNITTGANLLVTGWAADTTARGWAGISGVEVWNGAKGTGGTRVATGSVGLARTDVGDAIGSGFNNSGFSAIVTASALGNVKEGPLTLNVYLLTPGKGSWVRSVAVNLSEAPALAFANDPIVIIARPQDGTAITQKQRNNRITFTGVAIDRNMEGNTDPNLPNGPGCSGCAANNKPAGIASITAMIDGKDPQFPNWGAPCTTCGYAQIPVANGASKSWITRQYGSQYDYGGWSFAMNPMLLEPGLHTLSVTARSQITGKSSTATNTFTVLDLNHTRIQP
jgi:hypothetical protein